MTTPWFEPAPDEPSAAPPARRSFGPIGWLIVALVVVAGLGTVAAVVGLRLQPQPAAPSSPTASASALAMPGCDGVALRQFFATPAGNADEDALRSQYQAYAQALLTFACGQSADLGAWSDPLAGQWNSQAGYFNFDAGQFAWYLATNNLANNYYKGSYLWLPGCQANGAYTVTASPPCYSVVMRYSDSMTFGSQADDVFYGVFTVDQTDRNTARVTNQRSGGQFGLDRVG